jgi:hypothetical protein
LGGTKVPRPAKGIVSGLQRCVAAAASSLQLR